MTRPVMIPFRWLGHGLDLRVIALAGQPLFAAKDVVLALQLPPSTHVPDAYLSLDMLDVDGTPLELLNVDQVRALASNQPMYLDQGFSTWFEELIRTHFPDYDHLARLVDGALPDEPGHKSAHTYSVAAAAHVLTKDHGLQLGQERLFRAMNGLGWIHRDSTSTWTPNDDPVRAGYLVRRNVRVPGRAGYYPQILITDAGLLALAELLTPLEPALETP